MTLGNMHANGVGFIEGHRRAAYRRGALAAVAEASAVDVAVNSL
jgi:hypothetical protein